MCVCVCVYVCGVRIDARCQRSHSLALFGMTVYSVRDTVSTPRALPDVEAHHQLGQDSQDTSTVRKAGRVIARVQVSSLCDGVCSACALRCVLLTMHALA